MTVKMAIRSTIRRLLTKKRTKPGRARRVGPAAAIMVAALLLSQAATAKMVYRWINDAGRPEVSHSIPSEAVHRGYEILDGATGRLISTVPPQMSDEEYARYLIEQEQQAKCDKTLRYLNSLYEDQGDIHDAEEDALEKLDIRVENARQDLLGVRKRLESYEGAAARLERAGERVDESTLSEITKANNQIATLERELVQRENERIEAVQDYELQRKMFAAQKCDVDVEVAAN